MAKFILTAFNPANGQRARLHYDNSNLAIRQLRRV